MMMIIKKNLKDLLKIQKIDKMIMKINMNMEINKICKINMIVGERHQMIKMKCKQIMMNGIRNLIRHLKCIILIISPNFQDRIKDVKKNDNKP